MPRQDFRLTGRRVVRFARWLVFGVLFIATGCAKDDSSASPVELADPGTSTRTESGDMPVNMDFLSGDEIYVEQDDYSVDFSEDMSFSRCPDEPRNEARTVYLKGRTLTATAQDLDAPGQPLVHFVIESDRLKFLSYISKGSSISKAKYALTLPVMSDDLKYVAPVGAVTVMSCKNGFYIGPPGLLRTYKGAVRLEGIAPVFGTGLGGGAGCTDNELTSSEYDPYEPGAGDGCGSDGSGGSGGGGSGQQYSPGQYTNGETVSWATGVGNGGTSACGSAAQVDYICIDVWNETSGEWETWGCGYVTTC